VAFYGAGYFAPLYKLLLFIPLAILAPWLLVRSFAFNAYNTAYRNVRFRFEGTYRACLKIILVYGWLVFTGLLYPYLKHRLIRFVAENHRYGTTSFEIADFKKPFIGAYANAFGLGFLLFGAMFAEMMWAGALGVKSPVLSFGILVSFYVGLFLLFAYIRARTTNAIWNAVRIGPLSLESSLRARDLIWLYFSNFVAVVLTVGLATPWAAVRSMRYRASQTIVIASGTLDGFAQAEAQRVNVAGEEMADFFDIDIAL
jgi:uncharacterized membrane protein YjgN (DUF898 family)